jgi:hypothetical protein
MNHLTQTNVIIVMNKVTEYFTDLNLGRLHRGIHRTRNIITRETGKSQEGINFAFLGYLH